jgi:hypothetical protein
MNWKNRLLILGTAIFLVVGTLLVARHLEMQAETQAELRARIAQLEEYQINRAEILTMQIAELEKVVVGATANPGEEARIRTLDGAAPPLPHATQLDDLEYRIWVLERGGWGECISGDDTSCVWEWK